MKNNQTFNSSRPIYPQIKDKELKRSTSTQNGLKMPKLFPKNYANSNNSINHSPPSTKDCFYISSYSPNNERIINSQSQRLEIESLRDKVLKIKYQYNIKLKEIHDLKITCNKLSDENRNYIKIIETMLRKANKNSPEKISNDINDLLETGDFSEKTINNSLKETVRIINLKKKLNDFKKEIEIKQNELEAYKQNTKVAKLNELEVKVLKKEGENEKLIKENEGIKMKNEYLEKKLAEAFATLDYYKSLSNQQSIKIKDLNNTLDSKIKEENGYRTTRNGLEEKISSSKHTICTLKNQIKERDETITKLTNEKEELNHFKSEKDNYERNEQANRKKIRTLSVENEKLTNKTNRLEEENKDYVQKISFYEKERNKYLPLIKEPQVSLSNKEKKQIIKDLENNVNVLQKENSKLKEEIEKIKKNNSSDNEQKNKEANEMEEQYKKEIDSHKQNEELKQKEIDELKKKTTQLEKEIQELKAKTNNTNDDKENLLVQYKESNQKLQEEVNNNKTSISELTNKINELNTQINSLKSNSQKDDNSKTKVVNEIKEELHPNQVNV